MSTDIHVSTDAHVATIEIRRPPHNYFDIKLIEDIAAALEALDGNPAVRAVVLAAQGQNFCAGANLASAQTEGGASPLGDPGPLYQAGQRIFRCTKPVVAAVQGAAIGGGLGLAMSADFRVTCPEARFAANFTRLSFHPGFGLTVTLPEAVGKTNASLMFYTSRRVTGTDAHAMGLASVLVPQAEVRTAALALAAEIATCAPLGLASTRATMRRGLADRVAAATERELAEQNRLRATEDYREGVKSVAERRPGKFLGR